MVHVPSFFCPFDFWPAPIYCSGWPSQIASTYLPQLLPHHYTPHHWGPVRGAAGIAHGCPGYTWLSRCAPPFPLFFFFTTHLPSVCLGKAHQACVYTGHQCANRQAAHGHLTLTYRTINIILDIWYIVPLTGVNILCKALHRWLGADASSAALAESDLV